MGTHGLSTGCGGEPVLAEYKLYCLDGAKRIAGAPTPIHAQSDEEAITAAKALKMAMPCELWLGGRMVAAIPPHAP